MAIRSRTRSLTAAGGLDNALQSLAPQPIIANRNPTTSDSGELGAIWIYPATDSAWVLVSNANASATWEPISQGGAGTFTSLTVNPGPVNMLTDAATAVGNFGTGAGVKTIAVGSTNSTSTTTISGGSGSGAVLIQANTGDISLVGGTGSIIAISNDATAGTIDIGAATTVVKTIDIGSTNTTSSVTVNAGTTTGFIALNAVGNISVSPITAMAASPTASVTANHNLITATFTGFSTASMGTQAFTIVSSKILATSGIFVTVTCPTTGAALTVTGVQQLVGSIVVNTTNNGGSAVADNVIVNAWIIS